MSSRKSFSKGLALVLGAFLALIILPGCGKKPSSSTLGVKAALTAKKFIGAPYVYGGRSPKGFDCSGLVWYVYRQYGLKLPNSSKKQAAVGRKVARSELIPGDLVFFKSKAQVDHVGIYIGQGQMIHAPGRGRRVTTVSLAEKYYQTHFVTARRVSQ